MLLRRRTICEWEAPRAKHSHSPQLLNFISTLWVQLWESCCYAWISVCSCHVPLHVCVRVSERMTEWAHIKKSNWQWQRAGKLHTQTHAHKVTCTHSHELFKTSFWNTIGKICAFFVAAFFFMLLTRFLRSPRTHTHTQPHVHSIAHCHCYTCECVCVCRGRKYCRNCSWFFPFYCLLFGFS